MIDRITLADALETDVWMAVYVAEPGRLIDVQMRYADLVAIRKLIVRYCEEQSKADLINPIRCKDCKYCTEKKSKAIKKHCIWWYRSVDDDDFCSKAERKEE